MSRESPKGRFVPARVLLVLTVSSFSVVAPATTARAVTCPGLSKSAFLNNRWKPDASIAGFRAPVVLRTNASVCSGGNPAGASAIWVGIVAGDGEPGLSQRGWAHVSGMGYCRFWEWNDNLGNDSGGHLQHCDEDVGGDTRFFKIEKRWDPGQHINTYAIYDCGTSDWTTCDLDDAGPNSSNFGNSVGRTSGEVIYDSSSCTDEMMGSSTNPVVFGGSPPITGMLNVGGGWYVKPLDFQNASDCTDYQPSTHNDQTFGIFDVRN